MSGHFFAMLLPDQMGRADNWTIDHGTPGIDLMEKAGKAVADCAQTAISALGLDKASVLVLCGPGNNGGDGFIAARRLAAAGHHVKVALLGEVANLAGDAQEAFVRMDKPVLPLGQADASGADVIIDALFGAGLARDIEGAPARIIEAANASAAWRIAIDLPSGVSGASGQIMGAAFKAHDTVTFFMPKPGHYLQPGRSLAGNLSVADIGIDPDCLEDVQPDTFACVFRAELEALLPCHAPLAHKYDRGHGLVIGGRAPTLGACRLTAMAALRAGAGLVSLAAPEETWPIQAGVLTDIMVRPLNGAAEIRLALKNDGRIRAVAAGPGMGADADAFAIVETLLEWRGPLVLDADALTVLAGKAGLIARFAKGRPIILTPHPGEFKRLFPDLDLDQDKLAAARQAARETGAVVILKGPDSVVACPTGQAAISVHGSSWLGVAGSGDVLTGLVLSGLTQGLPARDAAVRAVWLHNLAASLFGPGMIASDLLDGIPAALKVALGEE